MAGRVTHRGRAKRLGRFSARIETREFEAVLRSGEPYVRDVRRDVMVHRDDWAPDDWRSINGVSLFTERGVRLLSLDTCLRCCEEQFPDEKVA